MRTGFPPFGMEMMLQSAIDSEGVKCRFHITGWICLRPSQPTERDDEVDAADHGPPVAGDSRGSAASSAFERADRFHSGDGAIRRPRTRDHRPDLAESQSPWIASTTRSARAHHRARSRRDSKTRRSKSVDAAKANVTRLANLLLQWNAYPRGIERDLPFFMDERQLRITPIMTLTTREGFIDVLDLPTLIDAKKAAGRPKDIDQLPELEALLALR